MVRPFLRAYNLFRPFVTNYRAGARHGDASPAQAAASSLWAAGVAGTGLGVVMAAASVAHAEASPPELESPGVWGQAQGYWRRAQAFVPAGWWGAGAARHVPLPTDKLRCSAQPHAPAVPGGRPIGYRPVVLVACGSFNPPTISHLRMMELARDAMTAQGYDVLGGYLSPVSDAYWKEELASSGHRVAMAQAAVATSDFLMVDAWEAAQPHYTRTLVELQRVQSELARQFGTGDDAGLSPNATAPTAPRAVLVCGADVLESMADPSLWRQDLLEQLLAQHGVVCVTRKGAAAAALLEAPGTLLHAHRGRVAVVQEPIPNDISSSLLRRELANGRSVQYLVPDVALEYIYRHGLYGSGVRLRHQATAPDQTGPGDWGPA